MEKNLPPHKKVAAWFKTLWLCYVTEIQDRILMSWKRLIKFIGISLVPIIYGVVCLVAFWNPIDNIGRAPMAIMNLDHNIILVKQFDTNFAKNDQSESDNGTNAILSYKLGALTYQDPNNPIPGDEDNTLFPGGNSVENLNNWIRNNMVEGNPYHLNNGQSFVYSKDRTNLSVTSVWEIIKGMLLPKTSNDIKDEDYVFKTAKIGGKIALTNIHYISDKTKVDKNWQGSKYYVQARIPDSFSADFFGWLGSVINKWPDQENANRDRPEDWKDILKPLELWTTFERNFIFGYYMQTFETFASGLIYQAIPNLFSDFLTGCLLEDLLISGDQLAELNDPNNDPNFPGFNGNENFFLLRTGNGQDINWINDRDSLTPESLFGKLTFDGDYVSGDVGGKLLRTFQNIRDLKTSGVIEIIRKVLPGVSSDLIEFIVNSISNLLNKANDDEYVNATFYKVVTGQWENTNTVLDQEIFNFLTDMGFDTANPTRLKEQITIFPITGQIVDLGVGSETQFNNAVDDFMIRNPEVFHGLIGIQKWPAAIAARIIGNLTGGIRADDLLKWKIQGSKNGLYGIGLGQFFLVIGLWVGVLMQTFVFDRAKRVQKATASQWYLSKTMLMGTVVVIQATLLTWVAYACGFHLIGAAAMCYLWLWFMASGLMFVVIIQGLWFSVKDETIGKFLAVVFMVLSLAAGGGTFPAFSQFKFFEVISYVVPFTYVIRGTGAIIYGVSLNGTMANTTNVILNNWWPFFVFAAVFLVIGLVIGAPQRFKEMNWGSHRGYKVANALIALGQDPDKMGFRKVRLEKVNGKKIYRYDWNALKPGFDLPLYLKCRQMYPFEGRFKWWERKHHDMVQKPNWSDEDIMSRNE